MKTLLAAHPIESNDHYEANQNRMQDDDGGIS